MARRTQGKRKAKAAPVVRARRRAEGEPEVVARWWTLSRDEDANPRVAAAVWTWVDRLRNRRRISGLRDLIHEAIYKGRPLGSLGNDEQAWLRQSSKAPANLNITRSMVDTATARLTKSRTMPVISADDAAWSEKLFAKRVSRVIRRKMGSAKVERLKPDVIRAMLIRGTAVWKVVRNGGDTDIDHIPRYEIVHDPREARYGQPRCLAHVKPLAKSVLCEQFPEYAEAIEAAASYETSDAWMAYAYDGPGHNDHVEVCDIWHLPSGPDADDGDHVIAIRGQVLLREPWKRPRFPLVFSHWSSPIDEMWGQGLVEDLCGIQALVDRIAQDSQEGHYWSSALKLFQARTSNINKHHLKARHPVVVEYDGAMPQYLQPNPQVEQALHLLDWYINRAYEISGISQMAASSKNVLGSNASGKAIDTLDDIQSDRFAHVEAGWKSSMCQLAQAQIDEARAMYEEAHAGTSDLAPADLAPWIGETEWTKVDIDGGDYHLYIEPINFLPDTRAGRLEYIESLGKNGLIPDPSMIADGFDEPDMQRMNRSTLGPLHNLQRIMEGLADPRVDMYDLQPDEHMNLALGLLLCKGEYNEAMACGAKDHELQRYRDWMEYLKREMDKANEGAMTPSLPGAQSKFQIAQPNAMTLQPGLDPNMMPMPGMPPMGPPGSAHDAAMSPPMAAPPPPPGVM